jgi:cysteine desulfurase/selenocysteine lyase
VVIDALSSFMAHGYANVRRGAYRSSAEASLAFEGTRGQVARFLGASGASSVVFTRNATEAVNLVAASLAHRFSRGDIVLSTCLEHHSNIVPWQLLAQRTGCSVAYSDIHDDARHNLDDFRRKVRDLRPKLVTLSPLSNAFGTVAPLEEMVQLAKEVGALVMIDAAQAAVHMPLDMVELGVDFLAVSGHKLYGPTGVGVLCVRPECYELMEPYQGGGDMISSVTLEGSTWAEPPHRFEAGTQAIGEVIAFSRSLTLLAEIGMESVRRHDELLFAQAIELLAAEDGVTLHGPVTTGHPQSSIISFSVKGVHPHDVATIADSIGVQVRAGHHCAMPALKRLGLQATTRASIGIYTLLEDFYRLRDAIRRARKLLA